MRRSPYTTWIAEIMLQQTQVATVVPYFQKWLRRFPNALALAKASEEEVLRHWAGLGYYARARNLHRGAQILVESGQYPITSEGWRALPGIGPYTAGAIASLAFDLPEPILDGNVIRVLSRLFGLAFLPGEGGRQRDAYWELARLWPKESRSGDTNEALMELGALVCTPAAPRCGDCPMAFGCQAKRQRWQNSLPPSKPRACVEPVMGIALVAKNRNSVLMESRPKGSFLAGHDLFPLFLGGQEKDWAGGFAERFPGWKWSEAPREVGRVRHSIMNRRYDLRVMGVTLHASLKILRKKSGKVTPAPKWILGPEIEASLTNSLARKIWGQIKAD
jgi:A/G-specific adenine glycosylase